MEYFDMSALTAQREAELAKQPKEKLEARLDPDGEKGLQNVADLLTFLPEEDRLNAVRGFVLGMLLG